MDVELITLKPTSNTVELIPCAVRLKAPTDVARVATHFILLLDVSESMDDSNKLENVKKCSSLILNFMTSDDRVSLITFGEGAKLHLKRVIADEVHKSSMREVIQGLQTDGCTNLSAGLGYVREVCEGDTQKAGLLILTDGHINRGVSDSAALRNIITGLHNTFSHLSIHCVAYGSDHNEDLLRGVAEDNQGSYNVVNTIEDTAFAFGETLGGLISCAFQNVRVEVPAGSVVHGPHKHSVSGDRRVIQIGDVYAGTKPLLLVDIPGSAFVNGPAVCVNGMTLPNLENWSIYPIPQMIEERALDIELAQLRYTCSGILQDLRSWETITEAVRGAISERITVFESCVNESAFDGNPIALLLRSEVDTLRTMFRQNRDGRFNHHDSVTAAQHITSIAMGRGFSSPMAPRAPPRASRNLYRASRSSFYTSPASPDPAQSEEENPIEQSAPTSAPVSAFHNPIQARIASLMNTASQTPN